MCSCLLAQFELCSVFLFSDVLKLFVADMCRASGSLTVVAVAVLSEDLLARPEPGQAFLVGDPRLEVALIRRSSESADPLDAPFLVDVSISSPFSLFSGSEETEEEFETGGRGLVVIVKGGCGLFESRACVNYQQEASIT